MPEEYQFTPEEKAVFVEIDAQSKSLNQQAIGALKAIVSIHGLTGDWTVKPDYSGLFRPEGAQQ